MPARTVLPLIVTALLVWAARSALATSTVVPDSVATVQAGLDSKRDTVLVRPGLYPERLTLDHSVVLMSLGSPNPTVVGLDGVGDGHAGTTIAGFHFSAGLHVGQLLYGAGVSVLNCLVDSALTIASSGRDASVSGCSILKGASVSTYYGSISVTNCTIVGGLYTGSYDNMVYIFNNTVLGPAAAGISAGADNGLVSISSNTVTNAVDGIVLRYPAEMNSVVWQNKVSDCTGTAYRTVCSSGYAACTGAVSFDGNQALRCGGRGFDISGYSKEFVANTVDSVGSDGIAFSGGGGRFQDNVVAWAQGAGIVSNDFVGSSVVGNRVTRVSGDGISLAAADTVSGNTVGRCGGRGLVVAGTGTGLLLTRNTSYLNAGAGFEITGTSSDSIVGNIAHGNLGVGLRWNGVTAPAMGCDDWYGNVGGSMLGTVPAVTDVSANPLFCDLPLDDVHLSAASPLLSLGACGRIGALGQGCTANVAVPGAQQPRKPTLVASPSPSRGVIRFAWNDDAHARWLYIYDVTGALRWGRCVAPGSHGAAWSGTTADGRRLEAGVYYARLMGANGSAAVRFVLLR